MQCMCGPLFPGLSAYPTTVPSLTITSKSVRVYEVILIDETHSLNHSTVSFYNNWRGQVIADARTQQIGQQLESWVSPAFKPLAYAMILLRGQGYPCVFWGDLYGCGGDNPQQAVSSLSTIIKARNLFSYGETRDYWDHSNCVGWVRLGDNTHDGCAVVLSNGDEGCVLPLLHSKSLPINIA